MVRLWPQSSWFDPWAGHRAITGRDDDWPGNLHRPEALLNRAFRGLSPTVECNVRSGRRIGYQTKLMEVSIELRSSAFRSDVDLEPLHRKFLDGAVLNGRLDRLVELLL